MEDNLTVQTNDKTISFINREIARKTGSAPYLANGAAVTNVLTDMDHTPYTRWYRGVYYYPSPIVMEREAGWREIKNTCYNVYAPYEADPAPEHCYEAACSTIFPCNPKINTSFADRDVQSNTINRMCIVQYR